MVIIIGEQPDEDADDSGEHGKLYRYRPWLGHWKKEYDSDLHTTLDVVLQVGAPQSCTSILVEYTDIASVLRLLLCYANLAKRLCAWTVP